MGLDRKKADREREKKRELENKYTEINTMQASDIIFQWHIHHLSMCELNAKPYLRGRWA